MIFPSNVVLSILNALASTSTSNLALKLFLITKTMSSGLVHVVIGFPEPPFLAQALYCVDGNWKLRYNSLALSTNSLAVN